MDDSPQSDPGIQQKPTTENAANYPGYQQYADLGITGTPAPPPKRRNPLILVAIGLLIVLILATAAVFIQSALSKRAVACADEKCFNQRFSKCSSATYTDNSSYGSIKYAITTNQGIGCTVSVNYLKAKYSADMVGKNMTCDFDNRLEFQQAAQNVFSYPDDYSCKGNLADILKSLSNASGGS